MHRPASRVLPLVLILATLSVSAAACGDSTDGSTTLPTTSSSTATASTETFTGTVGQNGTAIHPFTVKNYGYSVLAGFTSLSPSTVTSLGMGIGAWDSATSTCGLNMTQLDAAKAGSTAISGTASNGNYCIRVYDGGNVPADTTVTYTLQVQHY
jgi:hypothetical protein